MTNYGGTHNEENIKNKRRNFSAQKRAEREQRLAKGMKFEASQFVIHK